ncbi:hypothetical protein [Anaeromyxobacter dehalogenans]|uniref:Lipoprotein n=2 Tax=Anaeromyxobacter dehalogenans TaxID=161493 RepID=Q2INC0_ANADE|nr:hypothetical protein [Anaeromyxobacter dehalogenans]ABC80301.1 hypothetical protein Adeh_0525 [Anaeromyxobacter dehalogenans 2CP-C]ACL63911.1 conserved hypothetical protein [Anaeromyxobacter dehalogenans 2CP-1]
MARRRRAPLALLGAAALLAACGGDRGHRGDGARPPAVTGGCGAGCPEGQACVDVPGDACTWPSDAGCPGACVVPVSCGGFAAIRCPDGRACVDDPRDDCAPPRGADCGGLCAPAPAAGAR